MIERKNGKVKNPCSFILAFVREVMGLAHRAAQKLAKIKEPSLQGLLSRFLSKPQLT